jgi:hypothetical protein
MYNFAEESDCGVVKLGELLPGQTAMDRPDLMARVFRLKKEQMLREIFHDLSLNCGYVSLGSVFCLSFSYFQIADKQCSRLNQIYCY